MKKRLRILSIIAAGLISGNAFAQRYVSNVFTDVTVTSDIVFGQNFSVLTGTPALQDLRLDFYQPTGDTETARPLIIFLHTGSFLPKGVNQLPTGAKTDSAAVEMCKEFAKKGYAVAAVAYRTGWNPQGDQDTRTGTILNAVYRAMQDTKVAVRFFRHDAATSGNTYKIDTNKIVLCGQGSGGYVALAYATLDKVSEIQLPKFINFTTSQPYVNQALTGDFEGYGGNPAVNKADNHVGYSSRISMVCNFGGAMGDSSWLEAGDVPIVGVQGKLDPFAPYTTGGVFVPGTNPPLFVVEVSGARDVARRASRLGINDIFKNNPFTDPYSAAADLNNEGYPALFPINGQANASGPWEWWNPADPFHANGAASNPLMSKSRALLFIDTLQNYFAPRISLVLGLSTGIENPLASAGAVKVFPNPSTDIVNISVSGLNDAAFAIEVFDAMGRVVLKEKNIQNNVYSFNSQSMTKGIYYVKVSSGAHSKVEKVVLY